MLQARQLCKSQLDQSHDMLPLFLEQNQSQMIHLFKIWAINAPKITCTKKSHYNVDAESWCFALNTTNALSVI